MRKARVYYKNQEAGILTQFDEGNFEFAYTDTWMNEPSKPAISLTLPKSKQVYASAYLHSFFFNMLPEGTNKETVCFELRIDKTDHFGLLVHTATNDTIGAVHVEKMDLP